MTTRTVVNVTTGQVETVNLTQEELEAAAVQYAAWQVEETARLAKVAAEEAKQAKFQEWLALQGDTQ
jgi:hypothetical protein